MPRDGSRTRLLLLDAAEKLVKQNGFAATSVDQVLEESGSSKGAFFHHFASKQALAAALVSRYVDADLEMLGEGLAEAERAADPIARVLAFIGHYEQWAGTLLESEASCLYIAALTEQNLLDGSTAGEVERGIRGWRTALAGLLQEAYQAAGLVDPPDAEELADHFFVTFEGAFLLCRSLGSADPMRAQIRVYRQLVAAVLGVR